MEFHQEQLAKHCRICGKRLCKKIKQAPAYYYTQFPADLLSTFGVDITQDLPTVHPIQFCYPCYSVTRRSEKARKTGLPYNHTTKTMDWVTHDGSDCLVRWFTAQRNKRKTKLSLYRSVNTSRVAPMAEAIIAKTPQGRPSGETPKTVFSHAIKTAPNPLVPQEDSEPNAPPPPCLTVQFAPSS